MVEGFAFDALEAALVFFAGAAGFVPFDFVSFDFAPPDFEVVDFEAALVPVDFDAAVLAEVDFSVPDVVVLDFAAAFDFVAFAAVFRVAVPADDSTRLDLTVAAALFFAADVVGVVVLRVFFGGVAMCPPTRGMVVVGAHGGS
ncbi:hypothetical protein ACQCX2_01985 [Propionibacteriaceae bacterium Y1700]|uniref:hypothetical protein n=1 Tax=Microlunatus sp. Y1700 TaxID=3418487 RepID=UPI003DA6F22C